MRFFLIITLIIGLSSCNDGDFDTLAFNFSDTVNTCGEHVLYRTSTSNTEALIILLKQADIVDEVGTKIVPITTDNVIYRSFDDVVGSDYFCADIPPLTPLVLAQWLATSSSTSKIKIETSILIDEETGEQTAYKHLITLENLVISNEESQEIFETYVFGSFNTPLSFK